MGIHKMGVKETGVNEMERTQSGMKSYKPTYKMSKC